MKTAVIEPAAVPLERSWTMADFAELVKARLTFLVLVTTAVGFYLGWEGPLNFLALAHAVLGTAFAAAGAAALNQWWEHRFDAIMLRTRTRPIPAGRMLPREGLITGLILSLAGVIYLALAVNGLSAFLAALTIALYLFAYTPLKRFSTTNTLVGAIPGAIPPCCRKNFLQFNRHVQRKLHVELSRQRSSGHAVFAVRETLAFANNASESPISGKWSRCASA